MFSACFWYVAEFDELSGDLLGMKLLSPYEMDRVSLWKSWATEYVESLISGQNISERRSDWPQALLTFLAIKLDASLTPLPL